MYAYVPAFADVTTNQLTVFGYKLAQHAALVLGACAYDKNTEAQPVCPVWDSVRLFPRHRAFARVSSTTEGLTLTWPNRGTKCQGCFTQTTGKPHLPADPEAVEREPQRAGSIQPRTAFYLERLPHPSVQRPVRADTAAGTRAEAEHLLRRRGRGGSLCPLPSCPLDLLEHPFGPARPRRDPKTLRGAAAATGRALQLACAQSGTLFKDTRRGASAGRSCTTHAIGDILCSPPNACPSVPSCRNNAKAGVRQYVLVCI